MHNIYKYPWYTCNMQLILAEFGVGALETISDVVGDDNKFFVSIVIA